MKTTTIMKKQYVKPATQVFEMNTRVNLLIGSDPDLFDEWGSGQF